MRHDSELDAALRAADRAARLIRADFASGAAQEDADKDITTATDLAAQEAILEVLGESFPGDGFIAEESTPGLEALRCWECGPRPRKWVIDPIDGSRSFARRQPEFCVMIALIEADRPVLGVVHEPMRDRVTWAVRGEGCFVRDGAGGDDAPCRVSEKASLADAVAVISRSRASEVAARIEALGVRDAVLTFSTGVKLAMVARGEADMCVNDYPEYCDWDLCAADILVCEAGGRCTSLAGEPLRYGLRDPRQSEGFVATNGLLHDAVLGRM